MSSIVRLDKKKAGIGGGVATLVVIVLVVLVGAFALGFLKLPGGITPPTQVTLPPSLAGTAFWVGDVAPSIAGADTLISGTNYQCGGALVCTWFYNRGSSGAGMPSSGYFSTTKTGNTTFNLDVLDKGIIYLEIDSKTNANLYQDVKRTLNTFQNRIVDFAYINIDTDTAKEMVYKIDATNIRTSGGGSTAASLSFGVWVGLYQAPTFAYNKPSSSPETGIGTAANQTRILVEYTFANTGRMFAINSIKLVINASEASYTIDSVSLSTYGNNGIQTLSLGQSAFSTQISTFAKSSGATVGGNTKNVTYQYTICKEIDCLFRSPSGAVYSTATTKIFGIEVIITFRLDSGDIRFIQVGLEGLDDGEAVVSGKYAVRYFKA